MVACTVLSCVCVMWGVGRTCHSTCVKVRGQTWGVGSLRLYLGTRDQTQVSRLTLQALSCWPLRSPPPKALVEPDHEVSSVLCHSHLGVPVNCPQNSKARIIGAGKPSWHGPLIKQAPFGGRPQGSRTWLESWSCWGSCVLSWPESHSP